MLSISYALSLWVTLGTKPNPPFCLGSWFSEASYDFTFHKCANILWRKKNQRSLSYPLDRYRPGAFQWSNCVGSALYLMVMRSANNSLWGGVFESTCRNWQDQGGSHKECGKVPSRLGAFWPPVLFSWLPAHALPAAWKPLGTENADSVARTKIKHAISWQS